MNATEQVKVSIDARENVKDISNPVLLSAAEQARRIEPLLGRTQDKDGNLLPLVHAKISDYITEEEAVRRVQDRAAILVKDKSWRIRSDIFKLCGTICLVMGCTEEQWKKIHSSGGGAEATRRVVTRVDGAKR